MVLNTINEAQLNGKKVLIRVDFNCPVKDGVVTDNTRIRAALPTVKYILDNGASLIVMTHLGRPKGQKNPAFSLAPVAAEFEKLLGKKVTLASDVIGPEVEAQVAALQPGDVLLLRTSGSTSRKRRTILSSPRLSPLSVMSTATTRSAPLTAHMPPQRAYRTTFRPMLASSLRRK